MFRCELLGDVPGALAALEPIVERARRIHASYLESWAIFQIGMTLQLAGRVDEGRAQMARANSAVRESTVFCMSRLSTETWASRTTQDVSFVRAAVGELVGCRLTPSNALAVQALGSWLARADGDQETARDIALTALAELVTVGDGKLESRVAVTLAAETLATLGEPRAVPLIRAHAQRVREAIEQTVDSALRLSLGNAPWNRRLLELDALS